MREFVNRFGVIIIGAAIVLAAVIYFVFMRSPSIRTGDPHKAYYIDETTGDISVQDSDQVPPLIGKDGKFSVVQVVKISCNGGRSANVAYYRKFTDEAKAKIVQLKALPESERERHAVELQNIETQGEMMKRPNGEWVSSTSEEAGKIRDSIMCPNGQNAFAISPP